jgi:hypothetical protein
MQSAARSRPAGVLPPNHRFMAASAARQFHPQFLDASACPYSWATTEYSLDAGTVGEM